MVKSSCQNILEISGIKVTQFSYNTKLVILKNDNKIKDDLERSITIFKDNIGYSPKIFSSPFGEYISNLKKIVSVTSFI